MSSDVKHSDDELNLDTSDTKKSDVSTDEAEDTVSQDDSKPTADLDLTEDPEETKEDRREREKANMVASYASKILLGGLKIEDIPKDSTWLIPEIEAYIKNARAKEEGKTKEQSTEEVRETVLFELKVKEIKEAELTSEENKAISERFKYYRGKGFSKLDALHEALEFNRVELRKTTIPKIQPGGGQSNTREMSIDDLTPDQINKLSPTELRDLTRK